MTDPTHVGMAIFRVRHIETGEEADYECLDEGCARLLAAGDHGGEPEDWERATDTNIDKRDDKGVTHIEREVIEYRDGQPCPVCDRPRVFRDTKDGIVCGTGKDCGRKMKESDPCWTRRLETA